jgi:hypothetical protein
MSAVFGFSSVIGPLIGGFITDNLSWHWVFFVNLPIGIAAIVLVQAVMIEPVTDRHRHRLDWLGMWTLLGWTVLLVLALETGGRDYAWGSPVIVGSFVTSALLFVAFVAAELRASEPLIPFSLFRVPALRASSVISVPLGMVMFAIISFLPLFVQVVLKSSATDAGRVLTPMMLAVVIGSAVGAPVVLRIGYRLMCVASFAGLLIGAVLLVRVGVHSSQLDVSVAMVCIGTGMGFGFIATTLAAQNSVDLPSMGVATGLVNFTRQLGGVFGVAVAAALMLTTLTDRLATLFPGSHIKAGSLLSPQAAARFPVATQHLVRGAFADSLHVVFVAALAIALVGMLTVALMPGGKPSDIRDAAHGFVPESVLPDAEVLVVPAAVDASPVDASPEAEVPAPPP